MPEPHPQIAARSDAEYPDLCCPLCKGTLDERREAYYCVACDCTYPIVMGIPDFRVFPDPYIDPEDDYRKAEYILDEAGQGSFEDLVRFYWSITPEVSPERAERFMRRVFVLAEAWKERMPLLREEHADGEMPQHVLELGCGTGGFLTAASKHVDRVVGIDIAFRWLVVARKQLQDAGTDVPLICACAEYLPFQDDQFDFLVAESTLEHLKDQERALREGRRVADDTARVYLSTTNRWSLAPEPHVGVWGVGFLPRRWMSPYVEWVKGIPYEHLRPVSIVELRRLLRRAGFQDVYSFLPPITDAIHATFSRGERLQVAIYHVLRKVPVLHQVLYLFGPMLHVLAGPQDSSS